MSTNSRSNGKVHGNSREGIDSVLQEDDRECTGPNRSSIRLTNLSKRFLFIVETLFGFLFAHLLAIKANYSN